MKEEAKNWLKKAEEDLDAAKFNYEGNMHSVAIFLSQQAAEKALKAILLDRKNELIKTHDLVLLTRILKAPDIIAEHAKELTLAYIYSRYPDIPEINELGTQAKTFLKYAEGVVRWSEKQLS